MWYFIKILVYLRASPDTCLERLQKRSRKEEASVPIEYLEDLHLLHEDWLISQDKFPVPAPVLVSIY